MLRFQSPSNLIRKVTTVVCNYILEQMKTYSKIRIDNLLGTKNRAKMPNSSTQLKPEFKVLDYIITKETSNVLSMVNYVSSVRDEKQQH